MGFCWVTVHVGDFEKSLEFYQKAAGLPLVRKIENNPAMKIAFLGQGATKVELIRREGEVVHHGESLSLGIDVPDLDAQAVELARLGIAIHSGPFQPAPNVRYFYVLDPDGVKIQFVQNL